MSFITDALLAITSVAEPKSWLRHISKCVTSVRQRVHLVQIQLMKFTEPSESEKASQTHSVELATSHTSFQGLSVYAIPQTQQVRCAFVLCWLEVWHFSLVCFTCNFVTSYCSGCCFQCCLVGKLLYQCTKYGAPNIFCSTLSSKSKSEPLCSCVFACSTVLEHGTPLIMYYRGVGTSL